MISYWWLVLLTVGVGAGVAWYLTRNQPPMYQASASVVVGPSPRITNARETMEVYNTLDRRSVMATLSKMATSQAVMNAVKAEVPDAGEYETNCVVVPDTNILSITATGSDPQTAGAVASGVAEHTIPLAGQMYESFQLKVMDSGGEARASNPTLLRNIAAGALLGLGNGLLLALLVAIVFGRAKRSTPAAKTDKETIPSGFARETGVLRENQL